MDATEQLRARWTAADDSLVWQSEARSAAAMYIAALEAKTKELDDQVERLLNIAHRQVALANQLFDMLDDCDPEEAP